MTGAIGWMWRKLIEYSAGGDDDDPLPAGRFVLKRNLEVYKQDDQCLMIGCSEQNSETFGRGKFIVRRHHLFSRDLCRDILPSLFSASI